MENLRDLPSVDELIRAASSVAVLHTVKRNVARRFLKTYREKANTADVVSREVVVASFVVALQKLTHPSLRRVINATGVILHTNLGRAPLTEFQPLPRYSNLEFDLQSGRRGKRDSHTGPLLEGLLGTSAIVVNNNAAAVFVTVNELASGGEVLVSRGELVEIGDTFRIPDIVRQPGVSVTEVGTTNRTRITDYAEAITDRTKLILRVHPSNFHMSGFTGRPNLSDMCELAHTRGILVYEDLGSGCLVDLSNYGVKEPLVAQSLEAGVDVVSFSCDKLLGGPQSGIIAGRADLVNRIRSNPLYRALRVDKLVIESLETTLHHLIAGTLDAIPTLQMITADLSQLQQFANQLASALGSMAAEVVASESPIGGGSTPDQILPSFAVSLKVNAPARFERALRTGEPPILARIEKGCVLFDMRTVSPDEQPELISGILAAVKDH
jgi:L-seryl-tRNA(Ser) seleniumtransferase